MGSFDRSLIPEFFQYFQKSISRLFFSAQLNLAFFFHVALVLQVEGGVDKAGGETLNVLEKAVLLGDPSSI